VPGISHDLEFRIRKLRQIGSSHNVFSEYEIVLPDNDFYRDTATNDLGGEIGL